MNLKCGFQREKDIRSGKLDSERPSFEELTGWLGRIPKTWLPALLLKVVDMCERQHVFVEGGLVRAVSKCVEQAKEPIGMRRAEVEKGKDQSK